MASLTTTAPVVTLLLVALLLGARAQGEPRAPSVPAVPAAPPSPRPPSPPPAPAPPPVGFACYRIDQIDQSGDPRAPEFWETQTVDATLEVSASCYAAAYAHTDMADTRVADVAYGGLRAGQDCAAKLAEVRKDRMAMARDSQHTAFETLWEECCTAAFCNRRALPKAQLNAADTGATAPSSAAPAGEGSAPANAAGSAPTGASSGGRLAAGAVAGVAIGCAAGGAAVVAAAWWAASRRRRQAVAPLSA